MGSVGGMLIQEPEFCQILDECGFKDLTNYESPYPKTTTIILEEEVTVSIPKRLAKELGLISK